MYLIHSMTLVASSDPGGDEEGEGQRERERKREREEKRERERLVVSSYYTGKERKEIQKMNKINK